MTVFRTWDFRASGAPVAGARTMPERLSDIVNVKDWGALGTTSNDTAAIQAAINFAMSQGGGTVFFPQGTYLISGPLIVGGSTDAPITIMGTGKKTSLIGRTTSPAYADPSGYNYAISSGTETYDNIARIEAIGTSSAGLNIKATRDGVIIEEVAFAPAITLSALIGINVVDAVGAMLRSCDSSGPTNVHNGPDDPSPGPIRGSLPGSIGICLGDLGSAICCNIIGSYEIGFALSGTGSNSIGCRGENLGNNVRIGWGPSGETASYGASVQGIQSERVMWGIVLYNATGCLVASCHHGQAAGLPNPEPISLSWSGGTVTVTVTGGAHNVAAGSYIIQIIDVAAAWLPPGTNSGIVPVTRSSATQFTYALVADPGAADNIGNWSWPMEYVLRVRKAYECAIISNNFFASTSKGIDLNYGGAAEHRNCVIAGIRTQYGWVMPTTTANLAAWSFIRVGAVSALGYPGSTNARDPVGVMTYADLPTGSGVQDGPFEGQEFDIIDGNSATFDTEQSGGGSGHYKVRYKTAGTTGAGWYRIG